MEEREDIPGYKTKQNKKQWRSNRRQSKIFQSKGELESKAGKHYVFKIKTEMYLYLMFRFMVASFKYI